MRPAGHFLGGREGGNRISSVHAFSSHARKPGETRRRDDNCGICEINDVAQLSVINRGIITSMIINIVSFVRDNRLR